MKKKEKILKQIATHKAVKVGKEIHIIEKGIDFEDLHYPDVLLYTIPLENKDDLFAIFEDFEETNRCLANEFL